MTIIKNFEKEYREQMSEVKKRYNEEQVKNVAALAEAVKSEQRTIEK